MLYEFAQRPQRSLIAQSNIQACHNGFKPFNCEQCGVGYQTEEDLKTHI